MNPLQTKLSDKLARLTQRLDTKVLEPGLSQEENDRASAELAEIAWRLAALIPHAALSAEERVERLARFVPRAVPRKDLMVSDVQKLRRIRQRVDELVPGTALTTEQKLDRLAELFLEAKLQLTGAATEA